MLRVIDPELAAHLNQIELEPQLYGIRWIRLLFGREFPFEFLIALWTMIFADSNQLDLYQWIYIALLETNRDVLIQSDMSGALQALIKPSFDKKYNFNDSLSNIITMATTYRTKYNTQIKERELHASLSLLNVKSRESMHSPWILVTPKINDASVIGVDAVGIASNDIVKEFVDPLLKLKKVQLEDAGILKKLDTLKKILSDGMDPSELEHFKGIRIVDDIAASIHKRWL